MNLRILNWAVAGMGIYVSLLEVPHHSFIGFVSAALVGCFIALGSRPIQ